MPLVMALLMLVVQAALYFHTQAVATAAARKALAGARLDGGTASAGEDKARAFLAQAGAGLNDVQVHVTREQATAEAAVSGRVTSVLFGVPLHISVVVRAPVEVPTA